MRSYRSSVKHGLSSPKKITLCAKFCPWAIAKRKACSRCCLDLSKRLNYNNGYFRFLQDTILIGNGGWIYGWWLSRTLINSKASCRIRAINREIRSNYWSCNWDAPGTAHLLPPHQQMIIFDELNFLYEEKSKSIVQELTQVLRGRPFPRGSSNRSSRGVFKNASTGYAPLKHVNRRHARVDATSRCDFSSDEYVETDNGLLTSS